MLMILLCSSVEERKRKKKTSRKFKKKTSWSSNGQELSKITGRHQTTTPGCSENTKWWILPIFLNPQILAYLTQTEENKKQRKPWMQPELGANLSAEEDR